MMWDFNAGTDSPPSWATPPNPFFQAPVFFQAPFAFAAHAAFGHSQPPTPFTPGPVGPPVLYSAPHYGQASVSTRVLGPTAPIPAQRPHVTIHTSHHCSHHHEHVQGGKNSSQKKTHSKPNHSRPQATPLQNGQGTSSRSQSRPAHSKPKFSKCTGRKRALCIGINYKGQRNELHGCVNDARNVQRFLIKRFNYKEEDIFLLTDDTPNLHHQPTRANIIDAMHWLVRDAKPHDSLFFHYSGHGGQTKDLDGDEVDGLDEVIFPVDYKWTSFIVDDEMHKIMVKSLPRGCRLTAVFDSCHSGSALDLPYIYHADGREKGHSEVTASHMKEKYTEADVISWSGCMDSQTSADTWEAGAAVGAMSYAFMKSLTDKPDQSYQQLLLSVRTILKKKYSQKPQLSASHHIDTTRRFIM